jgi:2-dehydropantoate 2-reductase
MGGMQWTVFGAGAVGGVLAALLHEAGEDVTVVARGAHLDAIRAHGLTLVSPDGSRTVRVPAVLTAAELDPIVATTVLLCVKSHQTHTALEDLTAVLDPETPVVSVQNGVANEPTLLRYFADVQGVCVMMPTAHLEPGVVEQHSSPVPGILDVGSFPGGTNRTSEAVAAAFRSAGFHSELRTDVMAWKHRKLMMNLGNAAQVCCGSGPETEELADRAVVEGEAALAAAGIPVVSRDMDRERRGEILRVVPIPGRERRGGSSWQSLWRATGSIETDYLNGEVVRLGRLHDVPTPTNELLQRTARRLAQTGAQPGSVDPASLLAELG